MTAPPKQPILEPASPTDDKEWCQRTVSCVPIATISSSVEILFVVIFERLSTILLMPKHGGVGGLEKTPTLCGVGHSGVANHATPRLTATHPSVFSRRRGRTTQGWDAGGSSILPVLPSANDLPDLQRKPCIALVNGTVVLLSSFPVVVGCLCRQDNTSEIMQSRHQALTNTFTMSVLFFCPCSKLGPHRPQRSSLFASIAYLSPTTTGNHAWPPSGWQSRKVGPY